MACVKGFTATAPDFNQRSEEKENFESILKKHEGFGSENYDALILYSGGKDSSYLVRRIKDEFPKLQVDHIFVRPKKEFYIKLLNML